MARCPRCGHEMVTDEKVCRQCGYALAAGMDGRSRQNGRLSLAGLWPVLAGTVVVALILAAAILLDWVPTLTPPPAQPTLAVSPTPTRNTAVALNPLVSRVLVSPQVWDHDDLHELIDARWYASEPSVAITEGALRITGAQPWASWWGTRRTFEGGDAVLLRFRPGSGAQFEFHLERGTWATGDYRRWAFHVGTRFEISIIKGAEPQRWGELVGQLSPQPEQWYHLLLGMDPHGEFVTYLWEDGASEPQLAYRRPMDLEWQGPGWVFGAGANRGTVDIDSVTEVAFLRVAQPDGADAYFWRALALVDQDDTDGAIEEMDMAIQAEPDNSTYLYYRGLAHWSVGQIDEALSDLERASEIEPDNDEYHRQLAWLYARERGDLESAETHLERALALSPLEARNYRLRALILRDVQHQFAAAIVDLDNAIELSPQEAELYWLRGETHNLLGEYATGLDDGIKCANLQSEDAACYLQQARSYVGLDDSEAAVAAYSLFLDTTDRVICPGCREEAEAYIVQHQ